MLKKLQNGYERHFLLFDIFVSILVVFILAIIYYLCNFDFLVYTLEGVRSTVYSTAAGSSASVLGFVITGLSILLITGNNESIEALKKSKFYYQVFQVFISTSRQLGLLILISLICLLLDSDKSPLVYMNFIFLHGVIIVSLRIYRCIWVVENIIKLNFIVRKRP